MPAKQKLVIVNSLSPGDILMMSCAIRSLHLAYPGQYLTDVRSPCNEIFQNSPYITPMHAMNPTAENNAIEELKNDPDRPPIELDEIKFVFCHYPEIHNSSVSGLHFSDGHRMFLEKQLKISIPRTGLPPDLFLSQHELSIDNPMNKYTTYRGPYWIINAGTKNDYPLKWYPHYQKVVDLLKDKIQFVQVGLLQHHHPPLQGVIDMRGKTNLRELFRLSYDAHGAISPVSLQMVVMAAFRKPCVVIAGAREGVRWQLNPDHQFLHRNGVMSCASYDGCWKSRLEDCINHHPESGQPMCMELIAPEEVARSVELYYLGGRLKMNGTHQLTNLVRLSNQIGEHIKTDIVDQPLVRRLDAFHNTKQFFGFGDMQRQATTEIFNILRILKKQNPDDKYLEAYEWHYQKRQGDFMDSYHAMRWIGSNFQPARILEIGSRTGISICQLLTAYLDYSKIEKVLLCDPFLEQGSPEGITNNIQALNIPESVFHKIEIMKESSTELMPRLISEQVKFDYILVDGCHEKDFARTDLVHAAQLIDIGGFILFDDLTEDGCSLQDVWNEFKGNFLGGFRFYENQNGKGIGIALRVK